MLALDDEYFQIIGWYRMDRGSRALRYHQNIERRTVTEPVFVGAAPALPSFIGHPILWNRIQGN